MNFIAFRQFLVCFECVSQSLFVCRCMRARIHYFCLAMCWPFSTLNVLTKMLITFGAHRHPYKQIIVHIIWKHTAIRLPNKNIFGSWHVKYLLRYVCDSMRLHIVNVVVHARDKNLSFVDDEIKNIENKDTNTIIICAVAVLCCFIADVRETHTHLYMRKVAVGFSVCFFRSSLMYIHFQWCSMRLYVATFS